MAAAFSPPPKMIIIILNGMFYFLEVPKSRFNYREVERSRSLKSKIQNGISLAPIAFGYYIE
ncbi:hypothetical protein NSTCB13_07349 [Nostoc sp. DSM 114160]|jgi:hypothetical protein